MRRLWEHQAAAVQAACTALAAGGRATVVAACGTGKTVIGAETSRRLAPAGRVLVAVPAEDLAHTVGEWARWLGPAAGQLIAAAGDSAGPDLAGLPAQAAASAAGLARLVSSGGRVSVLCAYDRLPLIAAAHRDHRVPAWDLAVAADAHLTTLAAGPACAQIHHDQTIPAARRLYLTATPQITDGKGDNLAGMDDQAVFGPVAHRTPFATAVQTGTAASYRLAVAVVTPAEATRVAAGVRRHSTVRMAAAQLALARSITTWRLRQVITCHDQQALASRFAATLTGNLARMEAAGPPTGPVTPLYLDPAASTAQHRDQLAILAGSGKHTVLTTVTMPSAEAGMPAPDAVAFTGRHHTPAFLVQAIGHALRRAPGTVSGTSRIVTIIVPVLLPPASGPSDAVETDAFAPVWKVVRALRAHDEQMAAWLDDRRAHRHNPGAHGTAAPPWLHLTGSPVTAAFAGAAHDQMVLAATSPWPEHYTALCEFHTRHGHTDVPAGYRANGIDLRAWLDATISALRAGKLAPQRAQALQAIGAGQPRLEAAWQRGLAAAAAYHARHGDLRVPQGHVTPDGFALHTWLGRQRMLARQGKLTSAQTQALAPLRFDPDPLTAQWETALAQLRTFRDTHGHADVPQRYTTPGGFKLGNWLSTNRRKYHAGTLPAARAAALEHLGVIWDPAAAAWEHHRQHLAGYAAEHGNTRVHLHYQAPDGCKLGHWVARQRQRHNHPGDRGCPPLTAAQTAALNQLGMIWDASTRPTAHQAPRP